MALSPGDASIHVVVPIEISPLVRTRFLKFGGRANRLSFIWVCDICLDFCIRTARDVNKPDWEAHKYIFVTAKKTKTLSLSLSLSLSLQICGAKCNRLDFTPCRNCGVWLKFPYFQEGCPHCTAKRLWPGLVNFFPSVVCHFCIDLPAAFMQTGQSLLPNPSISGSR